MATKKLLGTLANYGWTPGVHKSLQFGEHSPARKAAGLGPDPLTQWRFFAVSRTETYGCDTKEEAEAIFKTMKEDVAFSPKAFTEWLTEEDTARLSVRPYNKQKTTGGEVPGFLITGRNANGQSVKVFVKKRSTADAAVAALKAGKQVGMDIFKLDEEDLDEDAPANCAGGGAIAGIGVGSQGEPGGMAAGGTPKKKRKEDYSIADMLHEDDEPSVMGGGAAKKISQQDIDDILDEGYNELSAHYIARLRHLQSELGRVRFGLSRTPNSRKLKKEEGSHLRRITREFNKLTKISEEVQPSGTFAGADVFDVTTEKFMTSRFGKNRYHRYSRYVGEDETGESIRQHGRSTKRDIILKDGTTGAMVYLRRKKPAA